MTSYSFFDYNSLCVMGRNHVKKSHGGETMCLLVNSPWWTPCCRASISFNQLQSASTFIFQFDMKLILKVEADRNPNLSVHWDFPIFCWLLKCGFQTSGRASMWSFATRESWLYRSAASPWRASKCSKGTQQRVWQGEGLKIVKGYGGRSIS